MAEQMLSLFKWGHAFLTLNRLVFIKLLEIEHFLGWTIVTYCSCTNLQRRQQK